jgi:signal transduction histidine kinase
MAITDSTSKARRETRIAEWWPHCSPLLHAVIRSGVTIHADIAADLPPIRMTPHDLTRLVLNLATNAADAIRERRRTGDSERRLIGELRIAATADCGGEAVKLTVSDNGIGMSPEILARVREPYFTTKAGRGGTGLGLMITEHLVSEAGGFLDIQSQPMEGTVVTIVLPAVSSSRPGDATMGRAADI